MTYPYKGEQRVIGFRYFGGKFRVASEPLRSFKYVKSFKQLEYTELFKVNKNHKIVRSSKYASFVKQKDYTYGSRKPVRLLRSKSPQCIIQMIHRTAGDVYDPVKINCRILLASALRGHQDDLPPDVIYALYDVGDLGIASAGLPLIRHEAGDRDGRVFPARDCISDQMQLLIQLLQLVLLQFLLRIRETLLLPHHIGVTGQCIERRELRGTVIKRHMRAGRALPMRMIYDVRI